MSNTKTFRAACKATAKGSVFTFVASTPKVDRSGESVAASWDLAAYMRNPVILHQHDHGGLPVGKAKKVYLDGDNLMLDMEFVPEDVYPFAGTVRKLYEGGFLSAVSVGFRVLEQDGPNIKRSELLEISTVAVPCNADALLSGKAKVLPIFKDGYAPDTLTGADSLKVKAWIDSTTKKDDMANDIKVEADVEGKLADGVAAQKSLGELSSLIEAASEACKAGDMSTCQSAIDAALAMVAALDADDAPPADDAAPGAPAEMAAPVAEPNKSADALSVLTKQVESLTERVRALDAAAKAQDEIGFASASDVLAFVNKTLGV